MQILDFKSGETPEAIYCRHDRRHGIENLVDDVAWWKTERQQFCVDVCMYDASVYAHACDVHGRQANAK